MLYYLIINRPYFHLFCALVSIPVICHLSAFKKCYKWENFKRCKQNNCVGFLFVCAMSHNVYYTCVKFGILQEEPVTYSCLFLTLLIPGIMIEFDSKRKVRSLQGWWILNDGVILKLKSIDINSVTFGDCCIKYPGTKRYKLVRRLRSAISIVVYTIVYVYQLYDKQKLNHTYKQQNNPNCQMINKHWPERIKWAC